MKVLETWDELKVVCEELCEKGNRWVKKYYRDAFNCAFLYYKGLREKFFDLVPTLEKLERNLRKHGYSINKHALLEDMYENYAKSNESC